MLFTYKHFLVFLHLWSAWCAATIRSFCSLSKNDPICTIVCDKFPRLLRKSEEKKELLGTAKSRQWPSDFVVMFAFYQLNCKNISFDTPEFAVALWYCDTDQFEGYPSLGFIFSIFGRHINHQQHYLSFEGERYRSRKCDFKCFSNVIKTAYINDKKNPLMLILLYLVRHFAHPCFNYSDITSIPKNEQKQWINCPLA